MLKPDNIEMASDLLWNLWIGSKRVDTLPRSCKPADRKEAYLIQDVLEKHSENTICGWKIAATSDAGQSHIGVSGPLAGRLLKERFHRSGKRLSLKDSLMNVAEAEFAFHMACDLPPRGKPYSMNQVLRAVDRLHPAIEIPDSRFNNFATVGEAQLIADNACAHEFVLGDSTTQSWKDIDLRDHPVRISAGKTAKQKGTGRNVLGDPRLALTWLTNELIKIGTYLKEGQVVTTGTITTPIQVHPGDEVVAEFGVLGSVSVSFID